MCSRTYGFSEDEVRVVSSLYILDFEQKLNEGRSLITIVNSRGPKVEPVEYHISHYRNQIEPQRGASRDFLGFIFVTAQLMVIAVTIIHIFLISNQLILLRRLKTVSSTNISMGHCSHSLSVDATIMVSKHCQIIGEHIAILSIT